ncbi:hypothetical protein EI77_04612 [Prosthecobacter fusiformis]|uniref:NACHT domain-containing protein n=1 Tax=Prosthecobacter fusiformis TaxID=48464 RepID=A0A4R7RJK9_9BACT|nr:leucine-rich repeat domain-containing protein [Prosthecobacter fusiformis]TDU62569.1 hypothetical protein EI77_04612 [Prosthecobacter fusiformis]
MQISPQTFAKFVGLGAGALVGGPLFACLGSTCGGFIGDMFASEDEGGWGLGESLTGVFGNVFASKVEPLFGPATSGFNHDLRRAGAQALVQALEWKKSPGPLAAALLKQDGFTCMDEPRREMLQRIFKRWRDHIQAVLDAAEKKRDGRLLDAILPPGDDDTFAALADGKLSAEQATADAWARFYQQALQPVLDGLENKDDLLAFNLPTLQSRTITCLAAVFPAVFSKVVKSGDHRAAWIAYQKTLLTATQRAVHEMGERMGQHLTKIEAKMDLLVEDSKAGKEWQAQLTQFLAVVKPTLEGQWKETAAIRKIVTSLQGQLAVYHADVQKVSPLAVYKDALFEAYAGYAEVGHPITGGSSYDARQALIGDIFVDPCCSAERVSPARMEAAAEDDSPTPGEDLLVLIQKVFTEPGGRRMVLLGDPGMGKSTLVRWLTVSPLLTGARKRKARIQPVTLPPCLKSAIPLPFIVRDLVRHLPEDPEAWDWDALTDAFRQFRATSTAVRPLLSAYDGSDAAFESLLADENALFLIDGLDEIGTPRKREKMSAAIIEGFARLPRARFIITSRFVGYEDAPVHVRITQREREGNAAPDGDEVTLAHATKGMAGSRREGAENGSTEYLTYLVYLTPFTDAQQDKYARLWFDVRIGPALGKDRATTLMAEVRRKKSIRIISRVPNLLCMMALLKIHNVPLPDGRAELYADISKAYLDTIQEARGIDVAWHGHALPCTQRQAEKWLAIIAMHLQVRRVGEEKESQNEARDEEGEEILATLEDLRSWLQPVFAADKPGDKADDLLRDFLRFITQRTAFLLERGEGQYGFAHLSFLEYYAACWLEIEFRRLLNQNRPKTWQHEDLMMERESFQLHTEKALWHEPLHFLAEILSKNEDDAQSLMEWLFPGFVDGEETALPEAPPLASANLLAALTLDKKVSLQPSQRPAIWSRLWQHWLAQMPEHVFELEHPWYIAPALLDVSDEQPRILASLGQHLPGHRRLLLHHCAALTSLSCLTQATDLDELSLAWCVGLKSEALSVFAASPKLKTLNLIGCTGVSDLSGLQALSSLQTLDLYGCTGLSNLSGLQGLSNLESLDLRGCTGVNDLTGLQGLSSLQILYLSGCTGVSDLSGLEGLSWLQMLEMIGCTGVSDLGGLQGLSGLQTLTLIDCTGVSDLRGLKGLSSLQELDLSGTGVSDLSGLHGLSGLRTLHLSGCKGVSDLGGLHGLSGLRTLDLSGCTGVSDLSVLEGLSGLRTLNLSDCTGVSDLSVLEGLSGLRTLNLGDCTGVSDLSVLEGLSGLQTLHLNRCKGVSDLSGLQGLSSLQELNLHGCTGVSDLSALQGLSGLQQLGLRGCTGLRDRERQVADLSKSLRYLMVDR